MPVDGINKLDDQKRTILFKKDDEVKLKVSKGFYMQLQTNKTSDKKIIVYICNYKDSPGGLPLVVLATEEEAFAGSKPDFNKVESSKVFSEIKEDRTGGDETETETKAEAKAKAKAIRISGSYLRNTAFCFTISQDANKVMTQHHAVLYQYLPKRFVIATSDEVDQYEKAKADAKDAAEEASAKSGQKVEPKQIDSDKFFDFKELNFVDYVTQSLK